MKLKVVYGYKWEKGKAIEDIRPEMIGREFKSFGSVMKELQPFECVTLQGTYGYKNMDMDGKGRCFLQKRWVPEY